MFNIAGSVMGIFTMTIFPVLFYNKAFWKEISWKRYVFHQTMSAIIFITGMISIVHTIASG